MNSDGGFQITILNLKIHYFLILFILTNIIIIYNQLYRYFKLINLISINVLKKFYHNFLDLKPKSLFFLINLIKEFLHISGKFQEN